MVAPSGEGAVRCMRQSLKNVNEKIQYINTHATSTPAGDVVELNAIREVFGDDVPDISSTKALTGHALGAAGVNEAVYCLLMMEQRLFGRLRKHPRDRSRRGWFSDPSRAKG